MENRIEIRQEGCEELGQLSQKFDVVVSNPPYIPTDDVEQLQEEIIKYEDRLALDGGYV